MVDSFPGLAIRTTSSFLNRVLHCLLAISTDDDPFDIDQRDSSRTAALLEHLLSSCLIFFDVVFDKIHIQGLEKLSGLSAIASPGRHIHDDIDAAVRSFLLN